VGSGSDSLDGWTSSVGPVVGAAFAVTFPKVSHFQVFAVGEDAVAVVVGAFAVAVVVVGLRHSSFAIGPSIFVTEPAGLMVTVE
jgi:hypothetical protein